MISPTKPDPAVKKVGKRGTISIGEQYAGKSFRQESRPDGSIVLLPVLPASKTPSLITAEPKVREALAWASATPPKKTEELTPLEASIKAARRARKSAAPAK